MVAVAVRAKGLARVKDRGRAVALDAQRQVQMPLGHPGAQVGGAHVVGLGALGVIQVKAIDTQLVGHGHIGVIGHALGDPVVAANGLEPPDLVNVAKGDAVVLVGAVALEQVAQDTHAVAGGLGIRQHQGQSTSGSAPRTRSLVVSVSVADMPTLSSLKPASAQMPWPGTTSGTLV